MSTNISYLAALKNLHPLWRISVLERANGASNEEIRDIQRQAKEKCIKEANILIQNLDFPGMESEWAISNFAGHIAKLLSEDWSEIGIQALQKPYADHLSGLATEAMYAGLPSSWHNSAAEVSYVATSLNAVSTAMTEYQNFNLFHEDQEKVHDFFIQTIITQAQRCAISIFEQYPQIKGDDSYSSLIQSFIKHAGIALADIWRCDAVKFIEKYKSADAATKQLMQEQGGDLKLIATKHETSMSALLKMSLKTLEASQPNPTSQVPETSSKAGSSLGMSNV